MKTVHIIALHLAFGGVEKAITGMANMFAGRYEVEIICVYNMPDAPVYPLNDRVRVRYLLEDVPNREAWKAALHGKKPFALIRESIRAVKILVGKKLAVKRAIKEIKEGVIITTRHEDSLLLSKYGSKNVLKIAQLHHDHNFLDKYLRGFKNGYKNIDIFTLLTPGLAEEVSQVMAENKHTKIVCVPNFLEHFPQNTDMQAKEKIILAAGRLDPVKGFDRLIESFAGLHAKAPDWKLRIIGEGNERTRLEELIKKLGLEDCVELPGRTDGAGVEREMLKASIYAMTSHSEGFPFVLIEAQSCALPAVAYDVRVGPRAVLTDGVDGFLVPDGDAEAYEQKMLELMYSDEKRKTMGLNGKRNAGKYSEAEVGRIWFSLLEEKL